MALAAALGGLTLLLAGMPRAQGADLARPAPRPGWKLIWTARFGGARGSRVNRSEWAYDTGRGIFGTGEIETMTSSPGNVADDGTGAVVIRAVRRAGYWTSGRIQTRRAFAAPAHGELRVTAVIRQPDPAHGLGYWPAFWLLGRGSWPGHGEVDIMEDVNGLSESASTLHCGNLTRVNRDGTTGPCHEFRGLTSGLRPCPGCQAGFHRYSVVIDRRDEQRQRIEWFSGGRLTFALSERQVGASAWTRAADHGLRIIFDLAVGGGFPDAACDCQTPTAATSSGAAMRIAAVSVWTLG